MSEHLLLHLMSLTTQKIISFKSIFQKYVEIKKTPARRPNRSAIEKHDSIPGALSYQEDHALNMDKYCPVIYFAKSV